MQDEYQQGQAQSGLKMQPYKIYYISLLILTYFLTLCQCGEKLFVVTGRPFNEARVAEIVDLQDPNYTCPCVPHYPERITNAIGANFDAYGPSYMEHGIVVCHGMGPHFITHMECYHLKNSTWRLWSCVKTYRRYLPGEN